MNSLFHVLGLVIVASPLVLLATLGLPSLFSHPLDERSTSRITQICVVTGLTMSIVLLLLMLMTGTRNIPVELGEWVSIPAEHFHFKFKFVFDRLSVPFVLMSFLLCGTISAFASAYLHREPGFGRFFVCFSLFLLGMILASVAGTIETLFTGWELVGLSSTLLVAFFQERPAPVQNGIRVWTAYRFADAAFLIAAVALHHLSGGGEFDKLLGTGSWPDGHGSLTSHQATFVGALLLIAAAGKSALIPFSGWLPRAMEGPTPSSAVFYGALSVHLGAFLLLRVSPLLDLSPSLSAAVFGLGLATAAFAGFAARVQSDIKSALSFASLTQVGIIVAEIGLGFRYIALIHIIGHASLRTLQLLRAPTLLSDYHSLENAIGDPISQATNYWRRFPGRTSAWFYRFALERGGLDYVLTDYLARPFLNCFRMFDQWERRFMKWLRGKPPTTGNELQTVGDAKVQRPV